jgi:nucleotide-binding universal stress UspA family protein
METMFKMMLHGLDGSESSFKALTEAIDLASRTGAELHTISVEEIPRYAGTVGEVVEEKEAADRRFAEAIAKVRELGAAKDVKISSHVVVGHEVKSIVEFVKANKFDLLVIGFMGHSAVYERVMGGTCQNLVRLAPCSVLVVK